MQLELIRAYCDAGWKLVPLRRNEKIPAIRAWQKKATSDIEQLESWIQRFHSQNIGLVTSANGIFVLDIDCKKGAGGFESLKRLMDKYGDLPETPTQRTPSGGYHLLFQYPHDCVIRNSSSQIGQGLDVRGLNGFIVVAPSQLSEGKYEWLTNRSIFDLPPAIAPKWLLQLIQNPPQEGEITQWLSVGSNRQKIREGEGRNQALISFAGSLRARNVEERAMLEMLHTYNVAHFDPPLDDKEVISVWKSIQRYRPGLRIRRKQKRLIHVTKENDGFQSKDLSIHDKPLINVTDRSIHDLANQAWKALAKEEKKPTLFRRNWEMVEVRSDENGHAKIYEVNEINLRGRLDRAAKWVRWKNMREAPTPPPIYVVQDMLNDPKPLPMIKGVTHVPIFSPDGVLETKSGYLPRSKMFYAPTQTQIPEVSKKPSNQEIKEALYLLNQELLIDFPFRDQSSKTHALSMIFLPFCRQMIHGPTPLNLIDGSRRGVGKSLLARITYLIAMGSDAAMVKLPKTEENLRSRLFLS